MLIEKLLLAPAAVLAGCALSPWSPSALAPAGAPSAQTVAIASVRAARRAFPAKASMPVLHNGMPVMPIYEYRCPDGHTFEVMQSMADDPVTECEVCGKPVERVFHPIAVHFKGSGFYTTDYAKKGAAGKSGSNSDSSDSSSDSKKSESSSSSSSDSKKSDSSSKSSSSSD